MNAIEHLAAHAWRRVHIGVNQLHIVYWGERITILIEGV